MVEILPAISDHNMVLASFDIGIPEPTIVTRTVFDYSKADWASIKQDLAEFDWTFMDVLAWVTPNGTCTNHYSEFCANTSRSGRSSRENYSIHG